MAAVKLGTTAVTKILLGTTVIKKIMLGTTVIYTSTP